MEKTKKQGFFRSVKNSIFSFDSYQDFALEETKKGIGYFFKLLILFSIIIAIVFSALQVLVTIPEFKNFITSDLPNFSYKDGQLSIENNEVVTIDRLADNILIIADTNELPDEKIEEYKEKINLYDVGLVVLKDKIYLKNSYSTVGIQEIPLQEIASIYGAEEFTKQDIINEVNNVNMISLFVSLTVVVFLGFFVTYLIISVLDIIILVLLSNIIATILRIRMKLSALINISIHSMTLPIILLIIYAIIFLTTGFEIKYFDIMYRGISYVYVITAIYLIRSALIKQKMELTAIVEKQKEVKEELEEDKKEKEEENKEKEEEKKSKDEEDKKEDVGKEANGEV